MVDSSDFERLAMPHRDAAFKLAYWIVRNRDDAEDAVQDAYMRAFRSIGSFRPGEAFRPWLLAIVRNSALVVLKTRQRAGRDGTAELEFRGAVVTGSGEIVSPEQSVEEHLVASADNVRLRAAFAELPVIFREVLVLRVMEELSYKSIAEITEVPIGTVMSRLARGRALLREAFARHMLEDDSDAM